MKRALLWSCILFLTVASGAWGSTALPGLPLPGYHGFSINVANEATTFYIDFASAGLGLNAEWVGPVGATSRTGLTSINTTSPSYSGSLAAYDTGGAGSGVTDFILLVSVQGSIASNFGVNLAWGTYNQTFTSSSFIYGPQTTKPGSSATALYPGQSSSRQRRSLSHVRRPQRRVARLRQCGTSHLLLHRSIRRHGGVQHVRLFPYRWKRGQGGRGNRLDE